MSNEKSNVVEATREALTLEQALERMRELEARAIAAEEDARIAKAASAPAAPRVPHVYGLTHVTRGAIAPDGKLWPLTSDGFEFHVGLDADGGKRVRLSEAHAMAICAELPAMLDAFYAPQA